MIQQGQVFKLRATCAGGEPLWAYRYRVGGRGSARRQVGGFSGDRLHDLYDLRHTYATFALGARVPAFALSRFMGTSIAN